jgi:DNA-binding transcriptional regulator GbsR (MarR family)
MPSELKSKLNELLLKWEMEIAKKKLHLKRLEKECEDIEGQYQWDEMKETTGSLYQLIGCYESLKDKMKGN